MLAGPAIANEFARGLPAAIVLAASTLAGAEAVRPVLQGDIFRVTTTNDVTGAALGGVLKNVYAILLGYVAAAAGESRNLEAAVLNTSLREMAVLAQALGAKSETIYGLAGLGDLVATGFSEDSHNRGFGYKLGWAERWRNWNEKCRCGRKARARWKLPVRGRTPGGFECRWRNSSGGPWVEASRR